MSLGTDCYQEEHFPGGEFPFVSPLAALADIPYLHPYAVNLFPLTSFLG